ncbi:MAG: GGDEF domain-containing protein, partial [Gemmatimonadota bacterium]|nr:GGDEF domain-containing protein [Gemmatimonadota bacterium]
MANTTCAPLHGASVLPEPAESAESAESAEPAEHAITEQRMHAEILLWQGRYRATFVPLVGFSAVILKWFDVVSSHSLYVADFGVRPLLVAVALLIVAYLLFQRLLTRHVRRTGRAEQGLVIAAIAADILTLFIGAALVTPPEHYDRVLVLSIFTVQITQVFFGWRATIWNLMLIVIGFVTLVALASDAGAAIDPAEELWTVTLYAIGVLLYIALSGQVGDRMRSLVGIFNRAQEGDFSARYDERADQMPDPVSVIGRAYNRMRTQLEAIVLTDALSGCYNRRGLNQLAEREVSRAVRGRKELAVLAVDVDHFKTVNDEFGHLTGDEVIREVGALLRESVREVDVVARIGGEEFAVLAPDSTEAGAQALADRVLAAFRGHRFRSLPPDRRITASVGVATAPALDDLIAKTLLARADEALYTAKRTGRDRAVTWHAGMRAFDGATPP